MGEENPADLLTKHSNSRQRLESLVTLFGCKYLDGRAVSAPQVRKGESSRITMADAAARESEDGEDLAALQEETSSCPSMPHLTYSASELDARYPPLVAPADEGLADVADDRQDAVYQHGLGIASDIREQVVTQGRRRRPLGLVGRRAESPHPAVPEVKKASSSQGNVVDHKEVLNLVTTSSRSSTGKRALQWQTGRAQSSCLRRSGKLWLPFGSDSRICKTCTRKTNRLDEGWLEERDASDSDAASVPCVGSSICCSHCHSCPSSILHSHQFYSSHYS